MSFESGHYYTKDGKPAHFVEKKDGSGLRPTTIADCRKLNLLPSVTQILRVLSRPQLERWKMVQAATAVLTSPRIDGENLDSFMERVLFQDKEQDEQAIAAAGLGTAIHDALETELSGGVCNDEIRPWIKPCLIALMDRGKVLFTEKILVGEGYAGKTDLIQNDGQCTWLLDYKSTTKLPEKSSWPEHRLQLAAYAMAYNDTQDMVPIKTANVYISTKDCGKFVIHENPPRQADYECFSHLVKVWQHMNDYRC